MTTTAGALTQGTVAFDNGNLQGNLDYAVFPAAAFTAAFGNDDYTPGDTYVYTYQIINSSDPGTDSISADVTAPVAPANTIGTFEVDPGMGEIDASTAVFVGPTANWVFNPEIPLGENSYGLAYSSPNLPTAGAALIVDGGNSVLLEIPVPGIPEPASVALLGIGGSVMLLLRRRNSR
ncbi:MAG: PEP-CTERM sorting domain-containing protein [Pirellulales bacterium]